MPECDAASYRAQAGLLSGTVVGQSHAALLLGNRMHRSTGKLSVARPEANKPFWRA
jgi:hypothetical protein